MADTFELVLRLGIPVVLLILGLVVGRMNERRHYNSIHEREKKFIQIPATAGKQVENAENVEQAELVYGSVVISVDYFKKLASGIRSFFGGEVRSYSSLLDRARREAVLRMKESAPWADAFVNFRVETLSISKDAKNTVAGVDVIAWATAIRYRR